LPRVDERGGKGRQLVTSYLPTLNCRVEKQQCAWSSGLILFWLVDPPLQPGVVGSFLVMGCMVPYAFTAGGIHPYPWFFGAVTGGP
jgi:hypothetical protein